jgi:Protein of unknown function (DUF3040)
LPLSEHEQKILEEIEKRLQEEDPRFAHAVSQTSLHTHLARRIRLGVLGFFGGLVALMFFWLSIWLGIVGFGLMLVSALLIYHQLRRMGREQVREYSRGGRFSLTAFMARLTERFRR